MSSQQQQQQGSCTPLLSNTRENGCHSNNNNYQSIHNGPTNSSSNSNEAFQATANGNSIKRNKSCDGKLPLSSRVGSSVQLRPMGYLINRDRQDRYRYILVVTILCCTIAIALLVWFWYLHTPSSSTTATNTKTYPYNTDGDDPDAIQKGYSTGSDTIQQQQQQIANEALENLNTVHNSNDYSSNNTVNDLYNDQPCETTVLVFRHCDKDGPQDSESTTARNTFKGRDRHCNEIGFERAQYITTLFGRNNSTRYPVPKYLFTLSSKRHTHDNYREYETLLPLSQKINVSIQSVDAADDAFASQYYIPLLQYHRTTMCGQVSIISWKHSMIPQLVNSLGCGPNNGCPSTYPKNTFDQVWELKFLYRPSTRTVNNHDSINQPLNNHTDATNTDETRIPPTTRTVAVKSSGPTFHLLQKKTTKHRHHHHNRQNHHHNKDQDDAAKQSPDLDPNKKAYSDETSNYNWIVMGTVTYQMFDPLQYSTTLGKYNP
jgi:hypothetical protein